ncbi:hypothetical protein J1N35_010140 [Gossypium stocksii]|uniref:Uncharacterized protein n=1 Tax=Gossypium stocksii TaxID=47602 RepID=A0A9D3W0F7_9ROSI|nr:hypothetical protein J1N35_010140 [Gossypium stocksii]
MNLFPDAKLDHLLEAIDNRHTVETHSIICFYLLRKDFRMSISDFNVAMGFVDSDNIQSDSYHTALLDIPSNFNAQDAYCTRTARRNMVFRQRPQFATQEQEEQPMTVEAHLSQIEARLGTMETQVATIFDILQSRHSQHQWRH